MLINSSVFIANGLLHLDCSGGACGSIGLIGATNCACPGTVNHRNEISRVSCYLLEIVFHFKEVRAKFFTSLSRIKRTYVEKISRIFLTAIFKPDITEWDQFISLNLRWSTRTPVT